MRNAGDTAPVDIAGLVRDHRPLAVRLARRYSASTTPDPDLVQVALMGLVLAARRYDPTMGAFRPYAAATAAGEIKKHLRSAGWAVRVPRRAQEASFTVARTIEDLEQVLGRSPTVAEIAERTGLPAEEVLAGLRARDVRFCGALPDPERRAPANESHVDLDDRIDVSRALVELDPEDRELLELRFDDELTQRQIAELLGVSQAQVHRRLAAVIRRLRAAVVAEGGPGEGKSQG